MYAALYEGTSRTHRNMIFREKVTIGILSGFHCSIILLFLLYIFLCTKHLENAILRKLGKGKKPLEEKLAELVRRRLPLLERILLLENCIFFLRNIMHCSPNDLFTAIQFFESEILFMACLSFGSLSNCSYQFA